MGSLEATTATPDEVTTAAAADVSLVEFPLVAATADNGEEDNNNNNNRPRHLLMSGLLDLTAFLKVTYNLDWAFSKFVTVALYKEYAFRVGVLFHKQGNRRFTLMDQAQFLELAALESSISAALKYSTTDGRIVGVRPTKFLVVGGVQITIRSVYGKRFVAIKDTVRGTSVLITQTEWANFSSTVPCITRYVEHLSCLEEYLVEHIDRVMRSNSIYVPPPQQLNGWEADRLHDEVVAYKTTTPVVF